MKAKLTWFNEMILKLVVDCKSDYDACCAIKEYMKEKDSPCSLDDAARYLINARLSEAALKGMT